MSPLTLIFLIFALGMIGWFTARARAVRFRLASTGRFGSLPGHHAAYVALWTILPPLAFLLIWRFVSPALVTDAVLATPAASTLPPPGFERAAILSEARHLSHGRGTGAFHTLSTALAPAYAAAQSRYDVIAAAIALLLALGGGMLAFLRVAPALTARTRVERLVMGLLLAASLIAILTTLGIVASLLIESARFFAIVPIGDFLFGTHWSPQVIDPADPGAALGAVPLFWGTFFIGAVIAMLVAIPFGLMSAIYLTQYAHPATRRRVKPMLEILAGVPTIVYGYFAALTVAPAVRDLGATLGIASASSESALAAGLVMGIMIIPFLDRRRFARRRPRRDARRQPRARRNAFGNDPPRPASRRAAGRRGGRAARDQPRDRRDDDRRDGRFRGGVADAQPLRPDHHRHQADRRPADRRSRVRQRQDARCLRARAYPVRHHLVVQRRRAGDRETISRGV